MKLAIVTDDLIQIGGQERLVSVISEMWPDAPIYTLIVSDYWQNYYDRKNVKIVTSFMQRLPFASKLNRYYFIFLFHVLGFEKFDFSKFDLVLSISSRYAHMVVTNTHTKHIAYTNSPGRMFWESLNYFEKENYGLLKPLKFLARSFLSLPLHYVRTADFVFAQRVDYFLANSKNIQSKIKKYYHRDSTVLYPATDFSYWLKTQTPAPFDKDYFLLITRLVSWKRVDIAIEACNKLGLKLKIVGGGPDYARLKALAGPTVELVGPVEDDIKWGLLKNCKALIQTQFEDFGLVPLEPMTCGKPVIAYGAGGALESIVPHVTGEFFYEQTADSLMHVLKNFDPSIYKAKDCIDQAKKFDIQLFKLKLKEYIANKLA